MKILLLADVKNIGKKGEVKNIPDGYACNFIIPRKLGEIATNEKIQKLVNEKNKIENKKELQKDLLLKELYKVHEKEITIFRKVNSNGSLFGAVSETEIRDIVANDLNAHIPLEYIKFDQIKHTGEYNIKIGDKKKLSKEFDLKLVVKGQ